MATSTLKGPITAGNVIYDNTQSGMTATDAQGAIDELNADINKGSVSVTADGVKTYGALLNELFNLADRDKISSTSALRIYGNNYNYKNYQLFVRYNDRLKFSASDVSGASDVYVESIFLRANNASAYTWSHTKTSGTTFTDETNGVPASGIVFAIFY